MTHAWLVLEHRPGKADCAEYVTPRSLAASREEYFGSRPRSRALLFPPAAGHSPEGAPPLWVPPCLWEMSVPTAAFPTPSSVEELAEISTCMADKLTLFYFSRQF